MPVAQFTNERVPLGLGLLLDISDSMFGRRIKDARRGGRTVPAQAARPDGCVLRHGVQPRTAPALRMEERPRRRARGARAPAADGRARRSTTRSLAAIPYIENRPRERARHRAHHRRRRHGERRRRCTTCGRTLVRSDAFVYAVAIDTPEPQAIAKRVNVDTLNEITGQSGGRTEVVRATADLDTATASIAEELNTSTCSATRRHTPATASTTASASRSAATATGSRARNGYVARRGSRRESQRLHPRFSYCARSPTSSCSAGSARWSS